MLKSLQQQPLLEWAVSNPPFICTVFFIAWNILAQAHRIDSRICIGCMLHVFVCVRACWVIRSGCLLERLTLIQLMQASISTTVRQRLLILCFCSNSPVFALVIVLHQLGFVGGMESFIVLFCSQNAAFVLWWWWWWLLLLLRWYVRCCMLTCWWIRSVSEWRRSPWRRCQPLPGCFTTALGWFWAHFQHGQCAQVCKAVAAACSWYIGIHIQCLCSKFTSLSLLLSINKLKCTSVMFSWSKCVNCYKVCCVVHNRRNA